MSCDTTAREANKMIQVCYDVEQRLPAMSANRKELLRLIKFAKDEAAEYTAADFFPVNRATALGFINVTTTYFIIVIQFHRKRG